MKRRCSDKRLMSLIRKALCALENPAAGFVFDDFDLRYRERERKRDTDSARQFYRNKKSFETKYDEDCGKDPCNEPAWVSDGGQGAKTTVGIVSYDPHGDEEDPLWRVLWRSKRLELKPKYCDVLDALEVDWRTRTAAKLAGVSKNTVKKAKKIFKVHFAQCHTMWKGECAN